MCSPISPRAVSTALLVALVTALGAAALATTAAARRSAGTIDPARATQLVRRAVTAAPGAEQPSVVACPGHAPAIPGTTILCTLRYPDGTVGTVTEHIIDGRGAARIGPRDLRLGAVRRAGSPALASAQARRTFAGRLTGIDHARALAIAACAVPVFGLEGYTYLRQVPYATMRVIALRCAAGHGGH